MRRSSQFAGIRLRSLCSVAVIAATLLLVCLSVPTAYAQDKCFSDQDPQCLVQSATPPPCLKGDGGDNKDYIFEHVADADAHDSRPGLVCDYRHVLGNEQPQNVLYAEWKEVDIEFRGIAPHSCGHSFRQSGFAAKEDPNSTILYGRAKQFSDRASAYIDSTTKADRTCDASKPQSTKPASPRAGPGVPKPPTLKSRVYAEMIVKDKRLRLDLQFETYLEGNKVFFYSIRNAGSVDVQFTLETLISRWDSYGALHPALEKSDWFPVEKGSNRFKLPPGASAKLMIEGPGVPSASDEPAELKIFIPGDEAEIAHAPVTVYLPPVRR